MNLKHLEGLLRLVAGLPPATIEAIGRDIIRACVIKLDWVVVQQKEKVNQNQEERARGSLNG